MSESHTNLRKLVPVGDQETLRAILQKIHDLDQETLTVMGAWFPMEELSSATEFDGIEGVPEGVFKFDGTKFEASATIYVTLHYGGSRDSVSMSDSYPAIVRGTLGDDPKEPVVEEVEIDNSSFYGEEIAGNNHD